MKLTLAILGQVIGYSLLISGLYFIYRENNEGTESIMGLLLLVTAMPVYGLGCELIGEIRADRRNRPIRD